MVIVFRKFLYNVMSSVGHHNHILVKCSFLAKPSLHVVLDPVARAPHEETVSFTCKYIDFSPQNITVKWFKDRNEIQ